MRPPLTEGSAEDVARRRPRRADAPGTGPVSADGPEPRLRQDGTAEPGTRETAVSDRDRWMLEQRPPHWG